MLFHKNGAHILADGSFGSCGKGALASYLARKAIQMDVLFESCLTNAGPNSGHTSYFGDIKIVLKQLPTFAVHSYLNGHTLPVLFTAGAMIDIAILMEEHEKFPAIPIFIHHCATMVTDKDRIVEETDPAIRSVAGTRSGTGAALTRKIRREFGAVYGHQKSKPFPVVDWQLSSWVTRPVFMEVSQGYSLGVNDPKFYPKVTSRECTFSQALADARLPPTAYKRGYLIFRTFPIRVGNVDGFSSGEWYPDQEEVSWEGLGLEPELTTVTKRVRRVATFSWEQYEDAIRANDPHFVCINFLNYFKTPEERLKFLQIAENIRRENSGNYGIIGGFGPGNNDFLPFDSGSASKMQVLSK